MSASGRDAIEGGADGMRMWMLAPEMVSQKKTNRRWP